MMARDDTGRRAICGRCDLEIERTPPLWMDRGGNRRCNLPGAPLHLAAGENVWTLFGDTGKRHAKAICGDDVTRSNVIGLRKVFNHVARLDAGLSGNRCNVTPEEAATLESLLSERQPRVSGELHDSGVKLLTGKRYAKRLEPVADIIADLHCFRLIGFEFLDSLHVTPIYRAIARDGRKFAFRNVPWQSGGDGPEILA